MVDDAKYKNVQTDRGNIADTYLSILLFIIGISSFYFSYIGDVDRAKILTREYGLVETLSAFFYLAGAFACAIAIWRHGSSRLAWIWIAFCVLFFGEETNWLQYYIGYSVPSVEQINRQNEFNIHTLDFLPNNSEKVNSIIDRSVLAPQFLFTVGFIIYFSIFPFLAKISPFQTIFKWFGWVQPSPRWFWATWSVLIIFFCATFYIVLNPTEQLLYRRHMLIETKEMIFAYAIFYYCILIVQSGGQKE